MTATKKNKEVNRLCRECCNFSFGAVALSVYCIICMPSQDIQEEEKQLSRESEISKFKEALKETRVRGIVFRVISRDDFSSAAPRKCRVGGEGWRKMTQTPTIIPFLFAFFPYVFVEVLHEKI
jgi:hypothetical protein